MSIKSTIEALRKVARSIGSAVSKIPAAVKSLFTTVQVVFSGRPAKLVGATFAFAVAICIGLGLIAGILYLLWLGVSYLFAKIWLAVTYLFVTLPMSFWNAGFWPDPGGPEWASLVVKILSIAAAIALLTILYVFMKALIVGPDTSEKIKTKKDGGKKDATPDGKPRAYQDVDWGRKIYCITPAAHRSVFLLFGKPWREHGPGLMVKLPFNIEKVLFIDQQEKPVDFTTSSIPTAGIEDEDRERGKDVKIQTDKPSRREPRAKDRIGAQGQFKILFKNRIWQGIEIVRLDPSLRTPGDAQREFFNSKIDGILRPTLNRIPLELCFHLPSIVMALGERDDIIGNLDDDSVSRWDHLLTTEPFNLPLNSKERFEAAARLKPNSFIGQMYNLGFEISDFAARDFNPEKVVNDLLDERTAAKLTRQINLTKNRQLLDNAENEREIREVRATGSGRSITVMLGTLKDDLKEKFNIDFAPTGDQVMQLIPFMEHYRTIRESREGQHWLIDFARFVPNIDKLLGSNMLIGGGGSTPPKFG